VSNCSQPAVGVPVESERVFGRLDVAIHALLSVVALLSVLVFARYWFSQGDWSRTPVVFTLMTVSLFAGLGAYGARWALMPLMRRPIHRQPSRGWRVAVATTFVPSAEPIEMLKRSVAAMAALDYPHDTWVLDEGDDPEVRALCAGLGVKHFSRHGISAYQAGSGPFESRTKHGNYNAWLDAVGYEKYDLVVNFDPDHVPEPTFLTRTLGYFDDEQIAYVQAAQVYYNQSASFVARGAAEETYAYYSSIQMTSYALGYPIVTGCHSAQRVTALQQVGGFAAHEADDLLITIYYRVAGWAGVYVPEVLATGITPVDWDGYLTQQRRWARSVLDVKFRIYPKIARRLPTVERAMSLAHGLYYLHGLASALAVGLLAVLLVSFTTPAVLSWQTIPYSLLLFAALQLCEAFRQRFFLRRSERGLHWRAGLLRVAKWPVVLVALFDALRPRDWAYSITRKTKGSASSQLLVVPHLLVTAILLGAFALGTLLGHHRQPAVVGAALLVALQSIALVLTSLRTWPAPFDPALRDRAILQPDL
jgi:cellulose synthase (UDP-forming)